MLRLHSFLYRLPSLLFLVKLGITFLYSLLPFPTGPRAEASPHTQGLDPGGMSDSKPGLGGGLKTPASLMLAPSKARARGGTTPHPQANEGEDREGPLRDPRGRLEQYP